MTDILISFDTTGSMANCIGEVRQRVNQTITRLFDSIDDLRIGLIAHGDYCDGYRALSQVDFTSDASVLTDFIKNNRSTGGGDNDEFYEYVLKVAGHFKWREDGRKIMILIGDANPHKPGYTLNGKTYWIDWREETKALGEKGVSIYTVKALSWNREREASWYQDVADATNGRKVDLNQFSDAVESIIAICYHGVGRLGEYKEELEAGLRMNRNLANLFHSLDSNVGPIKDIFVRKDASGLIPVPPARFQVLNVEKEISIQAFVEQNGITFKIGRGFYEFQKAETIQENKEVILQNRLTGDMFTGSEARNFIGLPFGERGRLSPKVFGEYRVFIQSTSPNRKLIPGYKFLYEESRY